MTTEFTSVKEMLRALSPSQPVYCIYPAYYERETRYFLDGFPGRVLFAVKANDDPAIVKLIHKAGVRHYDCASLPEIALIHGIDPESTCYFMTPARLRGAARAAQESYRCRHFLVDHMSGVESLADEIDMSSSVVFARMAVHHDSAMTDLSVRFGAPPEDVPQLLTAIQEKGAEPALAFNVGSSVTDPAAYAYGIDIATEVLSSLPFTVRLLDIGGGYPLPYPGFSVPPLADYFAAVAASRTEIPLTEDGELMGEPGRALAAPGLSAVVEVILRKEDRIFLNDGMYGIFWELRLDEGHDRFQVRVFRDGEVYSAPDHSEKERDNEHSAIEWQPFRLYGPTCDSSDSLPGKVELPADIRQGDYLEFGFIGAYSLAGRTRFNGMYSDTLVTITDPDAKQPGDD